MKLYDYSPSQNGWKVRALLALVDAGIDTEEVSIFEGESRTAAFLAKNPAGAIPVLELDDGRCIAESNAILIYLASATAYLPADRAEHAAVMQWLFFEQNYVEPAIGSLRYWTLTCKLPRRAPAVVAQRRDAGDRALDRLDAHLRNVAFLANNRFSIADLAVYAYAHLAADAGFELAHRKHFNAWTQRVKTQDALPAVIPYSVDPHSMRELA
jgi:glutathione S-transferase